MIEDYAKIRSTYNPATNISKPIMTKYEFNQVISLRMTELSMKARPFVDVAELGLERITSNLRLRRVALEELKQGKLPYIIQRPLPNGKKEHVRVSDLDLSAVRYLFDE